MTRRRALTVAVPLGLVLVLAVAVAAIAYFTSVGSGSASASVGTLHAPTNASVPSSSSGTVHVTWTDSTLSNGTTPAAGYYVTRIKNSDSSTANACGTSPASPTSSSATSCDDTSVTNGTYHYTVTAVYHGWTATSAASGNVTVTTDATAPTATIAFPADGSAYNATNYAAGCSPAGICGSAADATGVQSVKVSIKRSSDNTYWNGSIFTGTTETFNTTTLASPGATSTTWKYGFALPANGGYVVHVQTADTVGNAQTGTTYAATSTFSVDATAPTVTDVTATTANGSYKAGVTIHVTATFSEAVTVTGTPALALNTSPAETASYVSGSGTTTLTFDYTVQAGDTSADLDYASTSALALAGGTIRDAAANDATLTLASPGATHSLGFNKNIVIDTTAPTVTITKVNAATVTFPFATNAASVTSIGGACATGDGVVSVTVNGSAASPATATCTAGAWQLNFSPALTTQATYTLAASQTDTAGNTGSSGNQSLTLDRTAPTLSDVSATNANGSYKIGDVIHITIAYNEAVAVTGTPTLTLETGGTDRVVNYTSGSGTSTLTFDYTVQSGDTSSDLDYKATSSLALNGGTIKDLAGNTAPTTLFNPGATHSLSSNKNIVIDTTAPAVTITKAGGATVTYPFTTNAASVTSIGGACTTADGAVSVTVNGSAASPATATCTAAAWTLTFSTPLSAEGTYTLVATQTDTTGNVGSSGSQTLTIDRTAPTVTDVSATNADGFVAIGDTVHVTVTFSEPVTVTGTPRLTLNTSPSRFASYASGSGTSTLTFDYIVATGDMSADLDQASTSALAQSGGSTIKDGVNNATLTLASPGATHSLGANKNIVVDGVVPTATSIDATPAVAADSKIGAGDVVTYGFSEAMDPASLSATWDGSTKAVTIVGNNGGGSGNNDAFTVTGVFVNSLDLGNSGFITGTPNPTWNGTVTLSADKKTLTLAVGACATNCTQVGTVAGNSQMIWSPSTSATDLAGNAMSATARTETAAKKNF